MRHPDNDGLVEREAFSDALYRIDLNFEDDPPRTPGGKAAHTILKSACAGLPDLPAGSTRFVPLREEGDLLRG